MHQDLGTITSTTSGEDVTLVRELRLGLTPDSGVWLVVVQAVRRLV